MLRRPKTSAPATAPQTPGSPAGCDRPSVPEAPCSWQDSHAWLAQLGWTVSDQAVRRPDGQLEWTVSGSNGDEAIAVTASTRTLAWLLAYNAVRLPVRPGGEHSLPTSLN